MLGRGLLLFEFELLSEAEQVLARGKRRVKKNILFLEKWNPEVGCFCKGAITNEAWARVVGLPLHLWSCEVFKMIGDGCAGFIAMDENTASMVELQWARILVKLVGRDLPSYVQIVVGLGWGVSPFKFGGKPSLGLLRWCHREDVLGWVFQRTKMKLGEVHALCGGSLLENEGQSKVQVEGYRTCRPLEAIQRVLQPFLLHPLQKGLSKALRRMLWKEVK